MCAAAFAVLSLAWPYFVIRNETLPWPQTALVIGAVALLMDKLLRAATTRLLSWQDSLQ